MGVTKTQVLADKQHRIADLAGEYGAVDHLNSGIKIMSFRIELTSINDRLVVV